VTSLARNAVLLDRKLRAAAPPTKWDDRVPYLSRIKSRVDEVPEG
jgi:hypothetical protein